MGYFYTFTCSSCPHTESVKTGRSYFDKSKGLRKQALKGTYGEKIQQEMEAHPEYVLDQEKCLYVCSCGCWTNEFKKNILSANPLETDDFKVVKQNRHVCPECGKVMRMVKEKEIMDLKLRCPDCKKEMHAEPDACGFCD
ncbi:hypothetical protein [[Clostridium] aminophilum]|uniref:hypothetical protein n=1 Tax=[Clostridium] aminophilum TaxID=1526 RepID=UPI00333379D0